MTWSRWCLPGFPTRSPPSPSCLCQILLFVELPFTALQHLLTTPACCSYFHDRCQIAITHFYHSVYMYLSFYHKEELSHLFLSVWTCGFLFDLIGSSPVSPSFIVMVRCPGFDQCRLLQVGFCVLSHTPALP